VKDEDYGGAYPMPHFEGMQRKEKRGCQIRVNSDFTKRNKNNRKDFGPEKQTGDASKRIARNELSNGEVD